MHKYIKYGEWTRALGSPETVRPISTGHLCDAESLSHRPLSGLLVKIALWDTVKAITIRNLSA
jgi:hypothetical protein